MYNLNEELKKLAARLSDEGDYEGRQAISQAMIRIENLTYDLQMYKEALDLK